MAAPGTFGPFSLDFERNQLLRDGIPVPVGQRAIAVLTALVASQGRTVPKDELIARAWPEAIVEEGNLTVQIAALRKALGQSDDGQGWILTVPRVGYRLVAGGGPDTSAPPPGQPALAVLPFANLGDDPAQDWFADGVVDDIITALSRFRSFAVIARNSSFIYKGRAVDVRQVAQELGVRYVLEGSVRRAGDHLRMTAQLVVGATGAYLWAEAFDGPLGAVFDFQDRIAESVAMHVEPLIQSAEIARSRLERPGSIAAYDICLQALPKINNETSSENAEALALLTRALALEPDNALLIAYTAWALTHRAAMGWPPIGPDDKQRITELAHRGLQRAAGDPTVMAHCSMSLIHGGATRDYELAMAVLQSALEANPHNLLVVTFAGVAHLHCGSVEEALACFHRAARLSPFNPQAQVALTGIAHAEMILGNYQEALVWAARSLAINTSFDPTYWMLIAAHAHLGHLDEARRFLRDLQRIEPGVTVDNIRAGQPAKDPGRVAAILEGLRLAGLDEG